MPHISIEERQDFLRLLVRIAEPVTVSRGVRVCRDPKDDKFLEVAVNGRADLIVSGDDDLLVLDPFRGIPIVTATVYVGG